jgi:hypothetical protein
MSNAGTAFNRDSSKTYRNILKDQQQNQLDKLKSMRETLDNFMNDQNSGQVIKNDNSNKLVKKFMINYLKLSIIAVIITAITLLIIFGLSNI